MVDFDPAKIGKMGGDIVSWRSSCDEHDATEQWGPLPLADAASAIADTVTQLPDTHPNTCGSLTIHIQYRGAAGAG